MDEKLIELGQALHRAGDLLQELGARLDPREAAGELATDHDLETVAAALGMSTRWVRNQIKEGAAHQRYGNIIAFTDRQVAELRARFEHRETEQSITTGRKRSRTL